ncbi:MAG: response regulator transcription factor, partial [Candidatus Aminicenantales bacterium]
MRNEKILVVEFEENSLNTLMTLLEKEGFQVVTAKDGHEGLLKYEAENPDLVILEPMLLKLHGFDLCKKISKDSRKQTPVIITTGFYKGEHYREQALESFGASAFFEKPYDRDELLSTVMSLLGNGAPASQQEKVEPGEPAKPETAVPIEEKVKELEESIKTPEKTSEPGPSPEKGSEQELPDEIDKMLQNTLSEFGIHLDEKKAGPPAAKKAVEAPPVEEEQPEKQVDESRQEEGPSEEPKKEGEEEPQVQEEELKPEQLIAELIQKEETKEKEEEPEEEALAAQEAKQEILPPEEEV